MEARSPARRAVTLALEFCMVKSPISNSSHVHKSSSIILLIGNFVQTFEAQCHLHCNFVMSFVHNASHAQAKHGEQVAGHHNPYQWRDGGKTICGGRAAIIEGIAQPGVGGGRANSGGRRSTGWRGNRSR